MGPDLVRAGYGFSEKIMLQHLSRIAQLDQRTALAAMSALGGSGRAASKEVVRV